MLMTCIVFSAVGCGSESDVELHNRCDAELTECVKAIDSGCEAITGCVYATELACLDARDACEEGE